MKKALLGLGFLISRPFLIVLVPLMGHLLYNLWGDLSQLFTNFSLATIKNLVIHLGLLLVGSQQLVYDSLQALKTPGLPIYGIIHNAEMMIAGSAITFVLVYIVWRFMKGFASGSYQQWHLLARLLLVVVSIMFIGFLGVFVTFVSQHTFVYPFHGFIEIAKMLYAVGSGLSFDYNMTFNMTNLTSG